MSMANTARFRVDGIDGDVEVNLDPASWRGDVLETLEDHLGGESLISWGRRWAAGARLSEFRTRDIIGLVYLGRATADPDVTWQDVSRAIRPYTLTAVDEPATPPVAVRVDPLLGQQVPPPVPVAPSLDTLARPVPPPDLGQHAAHELPELYRQP